MQPSVVLANQHWLKECSLTQPTQTRFGSIRVLLGRMCWVQTLVKYQHQTETKSSTGVLMFGSVEQLVLVRVFITLIDGMGLLMLVLEVLLRVQQLLLLVVQDFLFVEQRVRQAQT
jgi:hypothetical protein